MSTVLFVKANDRPAEESISVKMYETFLKSYCESHPDDEVIELHLYDEVLPAIGTGVIDGNSDASLGINIVPGGLSAAEAMEKHLEQFLATDKIVFAFPLWNLTVPSLLHMYLDCLHYPGKTFSYSEDGVSGLLTDKKAALLNARGGVYTDDPTEMAVNFVRNQVNFFGITNMTECIIEGHHQYPDRSDDIIADGLKQVANAAKTF